MCIDYKLSKKEKEEWLKDKPDTIIAYKSVVRGRDYCNKPRLYSLYYGSKKPFKRKNRVGISLRRICSMPFKQNADTHWYMAYFHLYVNDCCPSKLIKCEILKKDITAIGHQGGSEVIVTRCFSIVGQDEYLD